MKPKCEKKMSETHVKYDPFDLLHHHSCPGTLLFLPCKLCVLCTSPPSTSHKKLMLVIPIHATTPQMEGFPGFFPTSIYFFFYHFQFLHTQYRSNWKKKPFHNPILNCFKKPWITFILYLPANCAIWWGHLTLVWPHRPAIIPNPTATGKEVVAIYFIEKKVELPWKLKRFPSADFLINQYQ